jgi:hypothetical protein
MLRLALLFVCLFSLALPALGLDLCCAEATISTQNCGEEHADNNHDHDNKDECQDCIRCSAAIVLQVKSKLTLIAEITKEVNSPVHISVSGSDQLVALRPPIA